VEFGRLTAQCQVNDWGLRDLTHMRHLVKGITCRLRCIYECCRVQAPHMPTRACHVRAAVLERTDSTAAVNQGDSALSFPSSTLALFDDGRTRTTLDRVILQIAHKGRRSGCDCRALKRSPEGDAAQGAFRTGANSGFPLVHAERESSVRSLFFRVGVERVAVTGTSLFLLSAGLSCWSASARSSG